MQPVTPPAADPADAPQVCIQINQEWLPYVVGALFQLVQPAAWVAASAGELAATLTAATELIERFGTSEVCQVTQWRFTADCLLQTSADDGATWTTVPGWEAYAHSCFDGAPGVPGATGAQGIQGEQGPAGPVPPPIPPNPLDLSASNQACNIASYLADKVIKASVQQVVDSINASQAIFQTTLAIIALIPGVDIVFDIILGAGAILFNRISAGTLSDYQTALGSTDLWTEVRCAIYQSIAAVGYVDSTNFETVHTALAAVAYSDAAVVATIAAYWEALGLAGAQGTQAAGPIYDGDCSSCPGAGCAPMASTAIGTGTTYDTSGLNAGTLTITADGAHYAGVLGVEPSQSAPYTLQARVVGTYAVVGFYSSMGNGGPDAGDNNWVNHVDIALSYHSDTRTWAMGSFGNVDHSGGPTGGPGTIISLSYDPATGNMSGKVGDIDAGFIHVGAAAYKPVVYGLFTGDVIDQVEVCI